MTINVPIARKVVQEIHEDIDQFLELWRLAYIEKRPIESAEWRMGMNLLVQVKVHINAAINEDSRREPND
jgi:hypothetical protein